MSDTNNICSRCGKQKIFYYEVQPGGYASSLTVPSNLCICCPPPKTKHDGKLDKCGEVRIWLDEDVSFKDTPIHLSVWGERTSLLGSEALSLLDWLQENREALEQLKAKEQR